VEVMVGQKGVSFGGTTLLAVLVWKPGHSGSSQFDPEEKGCARTPNRSDWPTCLDWTVWMEASWPGTSIACGGST
jgi:hypothetical protein